MATLEAKVQWDDSAGDKGPASEMGQRALSVLSARVQEDPYATLGIALGVGLLIGGGMWRLLARSMVGLGTRVAIGAVVASVIQQSSSQQDGRRPINRYQQEQ